MKRVFDNDYFNQIVRGVIGLGVAYICWSGNHLIDKIDAAILKGEQADSVQKKATEKNGQAIVRLIDALERDERELRAVTAGQREVRDKVIRLETIIDNHAAN